MPVRQLDGLLTYLRRMVFDKSAGSEDSDGQLLERYVKAHDELAFGALVRRHGTLVFGVARRILQNDHDAEDVFQATFAILARKAPTGSWRNSVAGWLYRVAFRMATRRRLQSVRQHRLEQSASSASGYSSTTKADLHALYSHLDRELNLLPDNYRNPLLLCYLNGKTRDQAAEQLGWSLRTIERRLEQGLKLLRQRLSKRGVELPMTLLAAGLSQQAAEASISNALILSTIEVANTFSVAGAAIRQTSNSTVQALVEQGLKIMAIEKATFTLGMFAAALAAVIGVGTLGYQFSGANANQGTPGHNGPVLEQNQPLSWVEGATVTGKVIDHKGAAVANAEVLMLGEENIVVEADRRTWFDNSVRKGIPPPSTRTNQSGEFSITRKQGKANRLVVISTDPILWSVPRKKLLQGTNIEIKLPAPSNLVIQTDLPGKPKKQTVVISLESLEGGDWHTEILRFQDGVISLANPGETIVEHLPPGKFAVERVIYTPTSADTVLMSNADRQFVKLDRGQRASIRFERKVGRPVTGHIRGLEKIDLRYAYVHISYPGPESQVDHNGRRGQMNTDFDVLPIASDGRFTTDPMPPGVDYLLYLFAVRASTLEQSNQSSDFSALHQFNVPATGAMPEIEVTAKPVPAKDQPPNTDPRVNVVDDAGQPVKKFQAMLYTANHGYTHWKDGLDGLANLGDSLSFRDAQSLDLIVRADGFASVVKRIEGADRQLVQQGKYTLTLPKGQKIRLRFILSEGTTWPKDISPEAYFVLYQDRVLSMRQPVNRQPRDGRFVPPDFNMLKLRSVAPGQYELNLANTTSPFYVAIHSPGFLQNFDAGPFTLASAGDGAINIPIPSPAQLDVRFDAGVANADQLPFKGVSLGVMRQLDGDSVLEVATSHVTATRHELKLNDLAPGNYFISARTQPTREGKQTPQPEINPGAFYDQKKLELKSGSHEVVDFKFAPFNPDAFKGNRSALLRFRTTDGKALANKRVKVEYYDGHYGYLTVYSGQLPASGDLTLTNLTDKIRNPRPEQSFQVSVDDRRLGYFTFTKDEPRSEFDFTPIPDAGDTTPDVELTNLNTGKTIRLSSLRGRVVCLDFWATWCGPCQPAMAQLDILNKEQRGGWKSRVAILPVSIDNKADRASSYVKQAGWDQLDNHWSGSARSIGFDAPAARAFKIEGVPTSILIGVDGRILWRGHPMDASGGQSLKSRIEAALLK